MTCTLNACKLQVLSVHALVGLEDIIAKRLGRGGFGFGQMSENRQVAADGLLRQVKPEDLEAFGLIPEIIGRLPVIAPLDALGVDDLARILQTPKGSLIQQFRKLVRFHGADSGGMESGGYGVTGGMGSDPNGGS